MSRLIDGSSPTHCPPGVTAPIFERALACQRSLEDQRHASTGVSYVALHLDAVLVALLAIAEHFDQVTVPDCKSAPHSLFVRLAQHEKPRVA